MPQTVRRTGGDARVPAARTALDRRGFLGTLRLALVVVVVLVASGCVSSTDLSEQDPEVRGAGVALPGKYVSPGGDNANSGDSPDQPYRTVAYAVKQLNPGDTLYVMEGEFFESERSDSAVVVNRSGQPNAWIKITAFPGATPVLKSNQSNGIKVEGASYVEISNLELIGNPTGGTSSYSGAGINVDAIYGPAKNHHVRVLNNRISGFGAGGIPVTGSSHVEIRNNVVFDVAEVEPTQHSGISILESFNMGFGNDANGYSNYITGNIVYRVENKIRDRNGRFTDGNCIIMDRTKINGYSGRTLIANNLCLDNGGRGVQIYESRHVDVVNNTIYQNLRTSEIASSGGELGAFYSDDVHFANNIVYSRNGLKPARTYDASNVRFSNNLYVADTAPEYNGAQSSGDQRVAPGTAVVASPSTNPNPSNFQLQAGSPAVDGGIASFNGVLGADLIGRARVAGSGIDQGALESSSTAPATTTTTAPPPTTTAAPTTATTASSPTTPPPTTAPSSVTEPTDTSPSTVATTVPPGTASTAVARPPTTESSTTTSPATTSSSTTAAGPTSTSSTEPTASRVTTASDADLAGAEIGEVSPAAATGPTATTTGRSTTVQFRPPGVDGGEGSVIELDGSGALGAPAQRATADEIAGPVPPAPVEDDEPSELAETGGDQPAEVPRTLAFDDQSIPQAPVPPELPAAGAAALALLWSYYRPTRRVG